MALRESRQVHNVNIDFIGLNTAERGGILSYTSVSGLMSVEYVPNPAGFKPAGVQWNDVEHFNFSREPYPKPYRRTDEPMAVVGVMPEGDIETNWVCPSGTIMPGDSAYVGPSGTFTNDPSFGGVEVGWFLSSVTDEPGILVYRGLGFSRQFVDTFTKAIKWENNPADRVLIATPGFVKVRLNTRRQIR